MTPLSTLDPRGVRLLLFDIDGTITDPEGRIPAAVFQSIESVRRSGILCLPVTGRPAGWCDLIARTWPVDGVVGENGGLAFRLSPQGGMEQRFVQDEETRAQNRLRLKALGRDIVNAVPGCRLSSDQNYRELDLAIDWCEDVPMLSPAALDRIDTLFAQAGARSKRSSIHTNGWFGDWDKRSMCFEVAHAWWQLDLQEKDKGDVVFVGDSPNDEPMFEHFPKAVGVASVAHYPMLAHKPAYRTLSDGAKGFVEITHHLLATRPG